ncbi:MAG: TolC family outer membrane protein [Hyphomicrobiales bacterium]|nr:TolC family outer membrane protein [Hyphomicrobiales bacterium]
MGLVVTRRVIVFGAQKRSRSAFGWAGGTPAVTIGVVLSAIAIGPRYASAETMQSALARAYQGNPQLNAQRAIVRQSDEGVSQALSGYRPTLSATATAGRQFTNESGVIPPIPPGLPAGVSYSVKGYTTPWSAGLTGQQTLFNGEQTANKVRKAESQVSASRETLRMMEESVLLSAATVYMDVSRDTANLEVQQNNVRVLQRTLKDTQNRYAAGQVTSTDVAQAEAQLAAGEATLHAAESTLMTTRANYRRIIGVDPTNLAAASPVDRLAPTTLDAAIAVGTAENPTITAAIYGVDVAQLQVKIAEGALLPTLALQGTVQQQNYPNILTPNLFLGTAVLNLTVPIYQGGAEYSAIRLDKETAAQQRLSVDQVRDQTRANVVQSWGQLFAAKAQVEAATRQNEASERALNGVRNEAQAGQRTTLDVLNAEQALVNARVSLITAQHDRVVASYSLLSAVGRLSAQELHLPVSIYDPMVHYQQVRDAWFGLRTPDGR